MQIVRDIQASDFYMFIEQEIAGHTVRMGVNSICSNADETEEYMGDVCPEIVEYGIEYAVEVDFTVDGLATYQDRPGCKVRIVKALLRMYKELINATKQHANGKDIMLFCTPYEADGYEDYRIQLYTKLGFTFWQDDEDDNTNCLYRFI